MTTKGLYICLSCGDKDYVESTQNFIELGCMNCSAEGTCDGDLKLIATIYPTEQEEE